jgi:hypothetical protein
MPEGAPVDDITGPRPRVLDQVKDGIRRMRIKLNRGATQEAPASGGPRVDSESDKLNRGAPQEALASNGPRVDTESDELRAMIQEEMTTPGAPGDEMTYGPGAEADMYYGTDAYGRLSYRAALAAGDGWVRTGLLKFDRLTCGVASIDRFDKEIKSMLRTLSMTDSVTRVDVMKEIKEQSLACHPDKLAARFGGIDNVPRDDVRRASEKQKKLNKIKERLEELPLPSEANYMQRLGEEVDRVRALQESLTSASPQLTWL